MGVADTTREKFRKLASNRTEKALEAIVRIGNLFNRQVYGWEAGKVCGIIKLLRDEVAKVKARFEAPNTWRRDRFSH